MKYEFLYTKVENKVSNTVIDGFEDLPDPFADDIPPKDMFKEDALKPDKKVLFIFNPREAADPDTKDLIEYIKQFSLYNIETWSYETEKEDQMDVGDEFVSIHRPKLLAMKPQKVLCFGVMASVPFYTKAIEDDSWFTNLQYSQTGLKDKELSLICGYVPTVKRGSENKTRFLNFIKEFVNS